MSNPSLSYFQLRKFAKALHKALARGFPVSTPEKDCLLLVRSILGAQNIVPNFNRPSVSPLPLKTTPFFTCSPLAPSKVSLLLGITSDSQTNSQPTVPVWLDPTKTAQQAAVYGHLGSGRNEALVTLSRHTMEVHQKVLFLDTKGDVSIFAKISAHLTDLHCPHSLRVMNLLSLPEAHANGSKHGHTWDLFDGLNKSALIRFLINQADGLAISPARLAAITSALVQPALALAVAEKTRLRPSHFKIILENTMHSAKDEMLTVASHLCSQLQPLWEEWGDVFDSVAPEVSFTSFFRNSLPSFVLILAPDLGSSPAENHGLLGSVLSVLAESMRCVSPLVVQPDTSAVLFLNDLDLLVGHDKTIARLSQNHNPRISLVWGQRAPYPLSRRLNLQRNNWCPPKAHVALPLYSSIPEMTASFQGLAPPEFWSILEDIKKPQPSDAIAWDETQCFSLTLDYQSSLPLPEIYLSHLPVLPTSPSLSASVFPLDTNFDKFIALAGKKLSDRYREYLPATKSPPLSWCQETTARLFGFADWHEVNKVFCSIKSK